MPLNSMHPSDLLAYYAESPWIAKFQQKLSQAKAEFLVVEGLTNSLIALVLAARHHLAPQQQVWVVPDESQANYAYSDLCSLLGRNAVHLFPANSAVSSVKTGLNAASLLRNSVWQDLCQIVWKGVIVTYPAALQEKMVSQDQIEAQTLRISSGEAFGWTRLVETLQKLGLTKVEFVTKPGEYAIRGGIVDIFSYAQQVPLRLAFQGDTISRLCEIDPETQLTTQILTEGQLLGALSDQGATYQGLLEVLVPTTTLWLHNHQAILNQLSTAAARKQGNDKNTQSLSASAWENSLKPFPKVVLAPLSPLKHIPQRSISYNASALSSLGKTSTNWPTTW